MAKKKSINLAFGLIIATLLISFASAKIIIEEEPQDIYSIGDSISTSTTIEVSEDTSGELNVDLICDGEESEILTYSGYGVKVQRDGGERSQPILSEIGNEAVESENKECHIEVSFANMKPVKTKEFKISDKISMEIDQNKTSFKPNTTTKFEGSATKANEEGSEGILEFKLENEDDEKIKDKETTINEGHFEIEVSFKEDLAAGNYEAKFNAYEKNNEDEKTNTGSATKEIKIEQVPSNLEMILARDEVSAGERIKVETILHDQTGERIDTNSKITIRDGQNEVRKEIEGKTGKTHYFNTTSNEPIANWTIVAESQSEKKVRNLRIAENKEIDARISGSKVNITNIGNVPYNETVEIKIGNETTLVNASIAKGSSESYKLTAPEGEYQVTVYDGEEEEASTMATLTGNTIGAEKGGKGIGFMSSFTWIFVALVLGFVGYVFFQKTRNKTFFTREPTTTNKNMKHPTNSHSTQQVQKTKEKSKHGLKPKNKAEVSLSISGDKQKTTAVCIHLKNLHEMEESKGYAEQTLQKIVDYAEKHKAYTYEDNENLYFLMAPSKTKTFQNENIALNIAVTAKRTLQKHNKLFKKNIEFGISINSGEAIFKEDDQVTKFMSVSKLVPFSQKLAAQSKNSSATVLASKEITDKLKSRIKADKFKDQDDVYQITGIKKYNDEDTQRFIKKFQERMEKEKQSDQNSGKKKGPSKDSSKKDNK